MAKVIYRWLRLSPANQDLVLEHGEWSKPADAPDPKPPADWAGYPTRQEVKDA